MVMIKRIFLRLVAMETKCSRLTDFLGFYDNRALTPLIRTILKVVIGVANGNLRVTWLLLAIARILVIIIIKVFRLNGRPY